MNLRDPEPSPPALANRLAELASAEGGSLFVQYMLVTVLFSIVVGFALYALGEPLLSFYENLQLLWSSPFP